MQSFQSYRGGDRLKICLMHLRQGTFSIDKNHKVRLQSCEGVKPQRGRRHAHTHTHTHTHTHDYRSNYRLICLNIKLSYSPFLNTQHFLTSFFQCSNFKSLSNRCSFKEHKAGYDANECCIYRASSPQERR